jgi:hypothetical protein
MRKLLVLFSAMLVSVAGLAGTAGAVTLEWHGTMGVDLGNLAKVQIRGTGKSIVTGHGASYNLETMKITDSNVAGPGVKFPPGTSNVVDVTDPDTSGLIPTIFVTATLKTGTITGIVKTPLAGGGTIPVAGLARVCLLTAGCAGLFIPLDLTEPTTMGGEIEGLGIGGLITALGIGAIRISVQAAPWQLASANGINQTANGVFEVISRAGFVHGPTSSAAETTLKNSGVIQLITPAQVNITGIPANNFKLTLFSTLTLHFVPEPGLLLLIGAGVVGLALLGRSRLRD